MKPQLRRKWVSLIPAFLGLGFILLAVFAVQLGIDHSATWGAKRIFTFAAGVFLLLFSLSLYRAEQMAQWIRDHRFQLDAGLLYFVSGFCILFVIAAYVWFVSVGRWTGWPATTNYYDQLATAFRHGQLNINTPLGPVLSQLPNPYDPDAVKGVQGLRNIWDMSLYNGKIYVYFGAAPALLLAAVKFLYPGPIGDPTLTFAFICGLFAFESLLMFFIWRHFFSDIMGWTIALGILVAGLVHPVPWILFHPRIYETAVAAGQFFLVGGFFFAFTEFNRPAPSIWRWVLAGALWSLAVGTRALLAIPVIFVTIMVLWRMGNVYYKTRGLRSFWGPFLAITIPLVIGAIIIGWYDWARFGSALEAGLRYQIGMADLNRYYGDIFSLLYIPPNLYIYLLNPLAFIDVFPFIRPTGVEQVISHFNGSLPGIYNAERITGILYSTPIMLLAIIPATTEFAHLFVKRQTQDIGEAQGLLKWTVTSMTGSFVLVLISLLLYFYGTVRYILEMTPFAIILSMIGFWQGYRFLRKKPVLHALYVTLSIGLATISILAGVLLSFSSDVLRIKSSNPALLPHLIQLFMKLRNGVGF